MTQRSLLSLTCFGAASAWPTLVPSLENALMSPLQRATREAICGSSFHTGLEFMGHCATCWVGSALLVITGVVVLLSNRDRAELARARAN